MRRFKSAVARVRNQSTKEFEPIPALRGDTSYETAKRYGFEGTPEEWLELTIKNNGWVAECERLDYIKANESDVYTKAKVDELISAAANEAIRSTDMGSYHAFVAAVNENTVSAAFGKNNEDLVKNIGRQLAMYGWFKGDVKKECPFEHLYNMSTLNDMNHDIFTEIINSDPITDLVLSNEYAKDKIFEVVSSPIFNDGDSEAVTVTVTEDDLSTPFKIWYWGDTGNDQFTLTITINDVVFDKLTVTYSRNNSGVYRLSEPLNWSTFGITEAGEYTIVGSIPESSSSFSLKGQFTVYKSKPSYTVTEAE